MSGDDHQHRRKGKAPMTEEQLLKELEEKERWERLSTTMQMIEQMDQDDLEKVNKRVNDLLYNIEIPRLWEEMHAAEEEDIKAEENQVEKEKPVEKPVQFLQNKRPFQILKGEEEEDKLFKDEEEEGKFWEVYAKKMRLAERAAMKKENDSDASEVEEPDAFPGYRTPESALRVMIEEFRQDEIFGNNDAVLAQKTDSEADSADEDEDEEEEGSDEEEEASDEEEDESDNSDSD